jgi:dUTP pyrophosphatase
MSNSPNNLDGSVNEEIKSFESSVHDRWKDKTLDMPIVLSEGATAPSYAHEGDAGMDLFCASEVVTIYPGARAKIPTGVFAAIPQGHYGDIRSKSGLAIKHGLTCLTGTVDATFRGEIHVILINLGDSRVTFHRGDKIAQMVLTPYAWGTIRQVQALDETDRGANGFGSTGAR